MCEFDRSWVKWVEPAFLLWKPEDPDYERPPYMTRTRKDKPRYSPEKELAIMTKQVNASDGFDINYSYFRCIFNYHRAMLDGHNFTGDSETTDEDFLKRLALGSLEDRNAKDGTEYEFVKIVKANFHFAGAFMFLITFEVKDPYDDKIKPFQARVLHAGNVVTEYVFCRPKPNQGVEYIGIKKDVKKQK
ncbi:hypothetical protein V5N11_000836 [Cardamine amara subsp. amara]|uniref:Cystatin domain-containing protein n=1 Tax=Cardamine amara subsp. amara TaxID=228776 RepID=A0ABD0ZRP8_CARAN